MSDTSRHRPSNHARDGWMGPDVYMDPDPTIDPPIASRAESVCHRCGRPMFDHGIYHDTPPPDAGQEGVFDVEARGWYCPPHPIRRRRRG